MRSIRLTALLLVVAFGATAWADGIPRSARLVKDAGNQFLAAKKYPDAIDCYFQALEIYPGFSEAHYNLGVSFLKGYKALALAKYHFEKYLEMEPEAEDVRDVAALVEALAARVDDPPLEQGKVMATIAGRLLVSGSEWVKSGDRIEVAEKGHEPCACLLAEYIYPGYALTQRIWDEDTLDRVKPGLVATNASERLMSR